MDLTGCTCACSMVQGRDCAHQGGTGHVTVWGIDVLLAACLWGVTIPCAAQTRHPSQGLG